LHARLVRACMLGWCERQTKKQAKLFTLFGFRDMPTFVAN